LVIYYSLFTIYYLPVMYRKPKFLEVLHAIREEMSREADYDVDLFAEMVRRGVQPGHGVERNIRGYKSRAPRAKDEPPAEDTTAPHTGRRKRAAR
jgi:hypothetical protein